MITIVGIILLSVFPLAALYHQYQLLKAVRRKPGHFRHCDYNLTGATSGVCPECGESTAPSLHTADH